MKHIALLCAGFLFAVAVFAEEVSFTYQVHKSPNSVTVGNFEIEQIFGGSIDIKNTPHGYMQFDRFELRFTQKNSEDQKKKTFELSFDQDELDVGLIKTTIFKDKRIQVKLENVIKQDNPNAHKKRHPKYVVKSITYQVIITDVSK